MATMPAFAAAGYQFEATPDLSKLETRERLSQSAMDGLFAIADKWQLPVEKVGDLLGGVPRSTLYKLKTAAGTLKQDELTRISCCSNGLLSTRQSTWYLPGDVDTIAVGIGTEFEVLRAAVSPLHPCPDRGTDGGLRRRFPWSVSGSRRQGIRGEIDVRSGRVFMRQPSPDTGLKRALQA